MKISVLNLGATQESYLKEGIAVLRKGSNIMFPLK